MSKLSKLFGKPQDFQIAGELFTIHPMNISDIELFMDLESEKKRGQAMTKLISKALKKSVPDATDEEIKQVGLKYFKDFSEAILKVNGLADEEKPHATL